MPFPRRRSRLIGVLISLGLLFTSAPAAQALAPQSSTIYSAEVAALKYMNCIRTGGTLRTNGTCSGYGSGRNGGYRRPLVLVKKASDLVSRPYSKIIVARNYCGHYYGTSPTTRFSRAAIRYSAWGENIGCRPNSDARKSVLASHLNFQSERSYNGWHWRNIKNSRLTHVGIGLWKVGTRIRVTIDFYKPRS